VGKLLRRFADFDPVFFNISPREAINIDPQERLFIESAGEVLEDAGYTRKNVAENYKRRVGVFAGITKTGFDLYGLELWKQGQRLYPHTSFSSVANRVSYLLNLQGPSMPIDTMCALSDCNPRGLRAPLPPELRNGNCGWGEPVSPSFRLYRALCAADALNQ
jgi:acyl transferase domain-containing protein